MKRIVSPTGRRRSASVTAHHGEQDAWRSKATPRGPRTWPEVKRQFEVLGVPAVEGKTLDATLRAWGGVPGDLKPLLRLLRAIVASNTARRMDYPGERAAASAR